MTVTFIEELASARSATVNSKGIRTYNRSFLLETSLQSEGPYTVGSHASLPILGSTHSEDTSAFCNNINVKNSSPWKGWTVTYTYSNENKVSPVTPDEDEITIVWTSEIYQKPIFIDLDGKPIGNSAGDPFLNPPAQRDDAHLIAKIKCNVLFVPPGVIGYQNSVNDSKIIIGGLEIPAGLARMSRVEIGMKKKREVGSDVIDFYPMSFEVHIHKGGWHLHPLDAGLTEITGLVLARDEDDQVVYNPDGTPKYIILTGEILNLKDKTPVTIPRPLDGKGKAILDPTLQNAVFLDFRIYEERDFSILPGIDVETVVVDPSWAPNPGDFF